MQNCDPFHDREQLRDTAYYHREYSNLEMRHLVESLLKVAADSVMEFSKEINAHFVAVMDHETCTRVICTYGLGLQVAKISVGTRIVFKESRVGEQGSIGFSNSPHRDSCDKLLHSQQELILNADDELGPAKFENVKLYFERMKRYIGIGLPTTCGYHVCGKEYYPNFDLVAKFGVSGFTMDLMHNRSSDLL